MPRTTEGGGAVRWRMDGGRSNSLRRRLCARRDRQTAVRRVLSRDVGVLGDRRSCGRSPLDRGCSLTPSLPPTPDAAAFLTSLTSSFLPWGPLPFSPFSDLRSSSAPLPSVPAGMSSSNRSDEAAASARAAVRTRTPSERVCALGGGCGRGRGEEAVYRAIG